ncbi:MAG: GntR family transcriptional regulator [Spirochaetaceae bacterium]|jgi:DNA-binding LacI/PurR family transcriptional regulator|nr:GntR family transcriptional regulator [Spirochaetaceae bacterium]
MSGTTINRQDRQPVYRQIADILAAEIQQNHVAGDLLPGEILLSRRFDVERNTVRRALYLLVTLGLIRKVRGRGSQVLSLRTPPSALSPDSGSRNIIFVTSASYLPKGQSESFHLALIRGFEKRFSDSGYNLVIKSIGDGQSLGNVMENLNAAAVIFDSHVPASCYQEGLDLKIPCVSVNHYTELVTSVVSDNFDSAYRMARLMADFGHRQFACVTGKAGYQTSAERLSGFQTYLREAGIFWNEIQVFAGDWTFDSGIQAAEQILTLKKSIRPTALFVFNDDMAYGCRSCLEKNGLAVPGNISLAGFDNTENYRGIFSPLTTVDVNINAIIDYTAWFLFARLAGRAPEKTAKIQIGATIVDNGSIESIADV